MNCVLTMNFVLQKINQDRITGRVFFEILLHIINHFSVDLIMQICLFENLFDCITSVRFLLKIFSGNSNHLTATA